jgi:hypothetical protein
MRFVAVGQERHHLCAPRPATVDASLGMCAGMPDVTVVWERIELPYERVALRTPYGCFLSCQVEDGRPRMTLSNDLGPREAFEEFLWPDGEVSLRTCELSYVSVSPAAAGRDAFVTCAGIDAGVSERFRYVDPPVQLATAAAAIVQRQPQVPDMPRQFAHTSDDVRGRANGNGAA